MFAGAEFRSTAAIIQAMPTYGSKPNLRDQAGFDG
jgi:hypothetical protein